MSHFILIFTRQKLVQVKTILLYYKVAVHGIIQIVITDRQMKVVRLGSKMY